jgi:AcrR family transcriptional regulator
MTGPPRGVNTRPMRKRGAARRAAILKAAAELFLEQGYERTSLAQIIERAGGSKSLFYEQFGDKAGLFRTVVVELCVAIFEPMNESAPVARTPREALTQLGRSFLEVLWNEDVLALSRIVYTEGTRNPEIADVFFACGYEDGYARLAAYLAMIAPRPMPEGERLSLAMMFLTMLPGDAYDRRLAGASSQRSAAELERQIAWSVEWLLWKLDLYGPGSRTGAGGPSAGRLPRPATTPP